MLWLKVYLDEVGERQRIDVTRMEDVEDVYDFDEEELAKVCQEFAKELSQRVKPRKR